MPAAPENSQLDPAGQLSIGQLLAGTTLEADELLVSQIYRILWDQIVTLKVLPGQLMSEKEIAEALNASKTPVREALIRLEDAGLVNIVPKSGTYITPISINSYIEGCFVRLQLETGAVQRAAERGHLSSELPNLDLILEQQANALKDEDYVRFFSLDEALHETFFKMAGVVGVWPVLRRTQADVIRVRQLKRIGHIRRGPEVLKQHRTIVKAIKKGDPVASKAALIDHIGSLETELEQLTSHQELMTFIENQDTSKVRKRSGRRNNTSSAATDRAR